jgi:hypothetical protein
LKYKEKLLTVKCRQGKIRQIETKGEHMLLRELKEDEVEFVLTCEFEPTPIEGNCSAIDEKTDKQTEKWIMTELKNGNEWAWCCAHVATHWNDFVGDTYLGCCSYLSESDFMAGGYYADMKADALEDLNQKLQHYANRLQSLVVKK